MIDRPTHPQIISATSDQLIQATQALAQAVNGLRSIAQNLYAQSIVANYAAGLSGSTNGRPIKIGATASPGTTLHTAVAGTDNWDKIWLYLCNTDSSSRDVTVQWGGTTSPDDSLEITIAAGTTVQMLAGLVLQNGLLVKAFASVTNVVVAAGWYQRGF